LPSFAVFGFPFFLDPILFTRSVSLVLPFPLTQECASVPRPWDPPFRHLISLVFNLESAPLTNLHLKTFETCFFFVNSPVSNFGSSSKQTGHLLFFLPLRTKVLFFPATFCFYKVLREMRAVSTFLKARSFGTFFLWSFCFLFLPFLCCLRP